jgi:hypothetical protein
LVPAAQAVCAEIQNTPIRIQEIPVLSNNHPALQNKSFSPDSWVWFQLARQSVLKFKIHQSESRRFRFCPISIQLFKTKFSSSGSWVWFQLPGQSVLKFKIHQSESRRFQFCPISIQLFKTNPSVLLPESGSSCPAVFAEIQNTPISIQEIPVLSNQHPALQNKILQFGFLVLVPAAQSVCSGSQTTKQYPGDSGSIQSAFSSSKHNPSVLFR